MLKIHFCPYYKPSVNYFGMVSTTKKFLAIFKSQAASGRHPHTRIVNVVSVAGLVAGHGFSSYSGSKFAAEAFSSSLRLELKPFGVTVVTINPSCHKTPLAEGVPSALDTVWANLPEARRREYGNGQ